MLGLGTLTRVARELREDLTAAQERDPAARSVGRAEILLTYGHRAAVPTPSLSHGRRSGFARRQDAWSPRAASTFRPVNAFHVCGALLAAWAVVVAALGITRENFPGSTGAARLVGAISVLLVLLAIGTAVYTGATEEEDEAETEPAGFVRPA